MKFEAYYLVGANPEFLNKNNESLVEGLVKSSTFEDRGLHYCITDIEVKDHIIGGTLRQEYVGGLTTVVNKVEKPIEQNPWELTYFFIDIVTAMILIQKRKYSPKTLNHAKTETRIIDILRVIFLERFGSSLEMVRTSIGINNDYFKELLRTESVKQLIVTNLKGKKIPVGTQLHNPREEWDRVWAESWNEYDSNVVEEVVVRATKENDLSRSVIAKAVIAAEGDIRAVSVFDVEEEKDVIIRENSVGAINVDVNKDEEPVTVFEKVFEKIEKSRDFLRRFRRK